MEQAIQSIRNIIHVYERFANQPEWFIDEREGSIIPSLISFADTATKLNNSDNYKPTDEEQNYWNWMLSEIEEIGEKIDELIENANAREGYHFWNIALEQAVNDLYSTFNGRECENGEKLDCEGF